MKRTVLSGIILVITALLILSCNRQFPTAPIHVAATATPAMQALGSISGTIDTAPLKCPPCAGLPIVPVTIITPTAITFTVSPVATFAVTSATPVYTPSLVSAVAGAIVTAFYNSVTIATTTTDSNGNYTLSNLAPGHYNLQVTIPDYDVDNSMQYITVTAGTNTANQNLTRTILWEPGEVWVWFINSGLTDAQARQIIASFGCTVVTPYTNNPNYMSYVVTIPAGKTPPEMETIISTNPSVSGAYRLSYACACPA